MIPRYLIVGRPNVGKSTLFRRLTGRSALIGAEPGSTRDFLEAPLHPLRSAVVVDTGGVEWAKTPDSLSAKIAAKVKGLLSSNETGEILWVTDARSGVLPGDREWGMFLKKSGKNIWVVVNKCDQPHSAAAQCAPFFALGFDKVYPVSALHGFGIDDLLRDLDAETPRATPSIEIPSGKSGAGVRVVLVGRPNVGKSLLFNRLVGEDRQIVDETPGTTRDVVEKVLPQGMVLLDTAGIRKHRKAPNPEEERSEKWSLESIQRAHAVLFVLDAQRGIEQQDVRVADSVAQAFRFTVIVVNKWDAKPKGLEQSAVVREIRRRFRFLDEAPVFFTSALKGTGVDRLLPAVLKGVCEARQKFPTARLNRILREAVALHPPKGKPSPKFFYVTQRSGAPPVFEIFSRHTDALPRAYLRYLKQSFQSALGLKHLPLKLTFRESRRSPSKALSGGERKKT